MQPRRATRPGSGLALAALAVLATCGLCVAAGAPPVNNAPPKPLPGAIVAAWKKAGAQPGWMRVARVGVSRFRPQEEGMAGDLPALRFSRWRAGVLAALPAPAGAFGLGLVGTRVTDAGLKELARLKRLQALDLGRTKVTDAGLKELRRALPGCRVIR
jgi:hypothetical protein